MVGLFDEVVPNRRLAYIKEWNRNGEVSRVEVEFSEQDSAEYSILLLHTGLSKTDSRDAHDYGRDIYIEGLKLLLASSG